MYLGKTLYTIIFIKILTPPPEIVCPICAYDVTVIINYVHLLLVLLLNKNFRYTHGIYVYYIPSH